MSFSKRYQIYLLCLCLPWQSAFGWGELGHHLIGRIAAKILGAHPRLDRRKHTATGGEAEKIASFVSAFRTRALEEGLVANIPDISWRNLEGDLEEDGPLLGNNSHFLNVERYLSIKPESIRDAADFLKLGIPLGYEQAKAAYGPKITNHDFFQTGTLPWRAQQFATLYYWTLNHYQELASVRALAQTQHKTDKSVRVPPSPSVVALAFAGLLSHQTGDASQPYHLTADYDAIAIGQKGIHSYFETTLPNFLDDEGLADAVLRRAKELLTADASDSGSVARFRELVEKHFPGSSLDGALVGETLGGLTPVGSDVAGDNRNADPKNNGVVALSLALAGDSYANIVKLKGLDYTYAIATLSEAKDIESCKNLSLVRGLLAKLGTAKTAADKAKIYATKITSPIGTTGKVTEAACRRLPFTHVDDAGNRDTSFRAPTVSARFRPLIVERLAIAAALTADLWVRLWVQAGEPKLDFSFEYALKPIFVSPTDAKCAGYATKEDPAHFLEKDNTSALPFKRAVSRTQDCMSF